MSVPIGTRAIVHVNLHKGCFSVLNAKTHLLIAHVNDITLRAMEFRVREKCLDKIQANGVRAVCAYGIGEVIAVNSGDQPSGTKVTFNPFRSDVFHVAETGAQVDGASLALFSGLKVYVPAGERLLQPQLG